MQLPPQEFFQLTAALKLVICARVDRQLAQLQEHKDNEADDSRKGNKNDNEDDCLRRQTRRLWRTRRARRPCEPGVAEALRAFRVRVVSTCPVAVAEGGAGSALQRAACDGSHLQEENAP
jgi:hypothetical protein